MPGVAASVVFVIEEAFTPDAEALRVLIDPAHAVTVKRDLSDVRAKLGTAGASRRAADAVIEIARAGRARRSLAP